MKYLKENKFRLFMAVLMCGLAAFGVIDTATAAIGGMIVLDVEPTNVKELHGAMMKAFDAMKSGVAKAQETAEKALAENSRMNAIEGKTNDELKKIGEENVKLKDEFLKSLNSYGDRMRELEQKFDKRGSGGASDEMKSAGVQFVESEAYKQLMTNTKGGSSKSGWESAIFDVNRKALIANPNALTNSQPLVGPLRLPGIIGPGLRRFTVRDLLPNLRTSSNIIEYAQELVFTNNAGPQYNLSSPDEGQRDGAPKNESGITFQLANAPVITIAHYIPASRQIISDAPALQGYIDARLLYGLKLEEENELLNGTNTNGALNGLRNNQTAFNGGGTNQSEIDTLLKAFTQVSLSYFDPSGVVLHPLDWQTILLKKDTQGRYLFGDPHGFTAPSIWGKPVVSTQAIPQGQFFTAAFDLAAAIFDREDVSIRVAEQHLDWFTRNLIAILCEERLALAIFRSAAMVGGALATPG